LLNLNCPLLICQVNQIQAPMITKAKLNNRAFTMIEFLMAVTVTFTISSLVIGVLQIGFRRSLQAHCTKNTVTLWNTTKIFRTDNRGRYPSEYPAFSLVLRQWDQARISPRTNTSSPTRRLPASSTSHPLKRLRSRDKDKDRGKDKDRDGDKVKDRDRDEGGASNMRRLKMCLTMSTATS